MGDFLEKYRNLFLTRKTNLYINILYKQKIPEKQIYKIWPLSSLILLSMIYRFLKTPIILNSLPFASVNLKPNKKYIIGIPSTSHTPKILPSMNKTIFTYQK